MEAISYEELKELLGGKKKEKKKEDR
jgi:hypothetical protein